MRTILIAMPWRSLLFPAQQPAALKAWLRQHDLSADARHLYLDIAAHFGRDAYEALAERLLHQDLIQEGSYGGLLYPERREAVSNFARWAGEPGLDADFWTLWEQSHDKAFAAVDWQEYAIAVICGTGVVSSPESHYLAGIEAARRIKAASPATLTVLVGPDYAGKIGQTLLTAFEWVDYVINGEAETALLAMIQALRSGQKPQVAGLLSRDSDGTVSLSHAEQLPNLEALPPPDYDDYWHHPVLAGLQPLLRLDGSRGCWWDRSFQDPRLSCQFCNINIEWQGYRAKSIPRIIADLQALADRYGCDRFAFMDKVHRPHDMADLFDAIAATGRSWSFYAVECHLAMPTSALHAMKRAGVRSVQFGVEALTANLLQQMNKGAGVAKAMEILRVCTELEIATVANILVDFPGATADDVTVTLQRMTWLRGLLPLQHSVLNLGYGSPLATGEQELGNSPVYQVFLPEAIVGRLELMHKVAKRPPGRVDWTSVVDQVLRWQRAYTERPWAFRKEWQAMADGQIVAVWYDQHEQPTARRLPPLPGRLLDQCQKPLSWEKLRTLSPDEPEDTLRGALEQLVQTGLLAEVDGSWVTLALHMPQGLSAMKAPANV